MIRYHIFHNKRHFLEDSELLVVYKRGSGWKVLVFANFEMRRRGGPSTRRKRGLDPLDFGKSAILMFSIVQYISVFFSIFFMFFQYLMKAPQQGAGEALIVLTLANLYFLENDQTFACFCQKSLCRLQRSI